MARKSLARVESVQPARRVITVVTDVFINNFDVLGATHDLADDLEIRFHRHPQVNIRGDKVSYNFDIMISNGGANEGFNYKNVLPAHRYVKLPRYDKFTQVIQLINGVEEYKQMNAGLSQSFLSVPTWFVGLTAARSFPTVTGKVVVKPMDGARGVGQFVIDLTYVNLSQFNKVITRYLASEPCDVKFKALIDSFEGHVQYYSRDEEHEGEGLQALKEQGAVVQSFIPNVVAEYRVITGINGEPVYYQRRKLRDPDSEYPQATGGGNLIHMVPEEPHPFADLDNQHDLFKYLCNYIIGPLSSIDLFFTEDGQWGIFEFCNQFGVTGIPATTAEQIHADFLKSVVYDFIKAETPLITVNS